MYVYTSAHCYRGVTTPRPFQWAGALFAILFYLLHCSLGISSCEIISVLVLGFLVQVSK